MRLPRRTEPPLSWACVTLALVTFVAQPLTAQIGLPAEWKWEVFAEGFDRPIRDHDSEESTHENDRS